MSSVRAWVTQEGWDYACMDDTFFDLAPAHIRSRCARNIYALTDVCRLLWIEKQLALGYQRAIWADADLAVFAPEMLDFRSERRGAFAHELFLRVNADGSTQPVEGINNSLMSFERDRNLDVLARYRSACFELLERQPYRAIARTAAGPGLLATLATTQRLEPIYGVGLFTLDLMRQIAAGGGRLIEEYRALSPAPIGAANLCHFLRNATPPSRRMEFDDLYDRALGHLFGNASPDAQVRHGGLP